MLENTEGAIKNGQYRETGNIVYTVRRKIKQKQNTICVGHHYTQTNVNKVNKT
jgi:quinolinate synthase